MAANFIDLGAVQGATRPDVGAMQSSGGTTIDESITLGVQAAAVPTATANELGAVTLGVGASTGPTGPVSAVASLEADVAVAVSVTGALRDSQTLAPAVAAGVVLSPQASGRNAIALAVHLGVTFVDGEIFSQTRRGKSAVVVRPAGSGKVTVR